MTLHIGVTGTRHGGTAFQLQQAEAYLRKHPGSEVHTGGCIGFDEDMHVLARTFGLTIHMHPPTDTRLMTRLLGDVLYQPLPYLQRNHAIVDACDVLLAAPRTRQEEQRSGT